jgi:tetratricopeptide (TPR) repeat protein
MKVFSFNRMFMAAAIGCGMILLGLTACIPSAHDRLSPVSDDMSRSGDPESAAMQAFARANLMSIDGDFAGSLDAIDQAIENDPESAFLQMTKAEILLRMGQLKPAKKALEQTLQLDPDKIDAYLALSEVQSVLGEPVAAIESLTTANRLQPDDQRISLQLSLAYVRNHDPDSAIALLKKLIKESPDYSEAYLALARVYMVSGDQPSAVETYRGLLQFEPAHEQATLELGSLYKQDGKSELATKLFLDYLELIPENNPVRYQLVRIFLDQNDLDQALKQLLQIVQHDSDDFDAQYKMGLIYLQQRNPELAEQTFRELLTHNQEDSNVYALGMALEGGQKWQEAISAFEKIPVESNLYPDALIHRAYLLPKVNRRQEAITLLESQLAVSEPRPAWYEFLASLYGEEKNWSKVKQTLDAGLTLFPDNPSLLLRQAFLFDQVGDVDASLESARKILDIEANNAEALNFIAYSYAERNTRLEEAEVLALRAIELADAPHIRDTYGWILYRMKRFDDALAELKIASAGLPEDPTILDHLGDVYVALGRINDALSVYQKALDIGQSGDSDLTREKIDALNADGAK